MLEIRAFGTPTIVHFCVALLICAIGSAPWHAVSQLGLCLGVCGAAGMAYSSRVISHARRQSGYVPDAEDWFWYAILPLVAYAMLLAGGILLALRPAAALFVVAAAALVLMSNGIHNAWDTVTFIAVGGHSRNQGKQ